MHKFVIDITFYI